VSHRRSGLVALAAFGLLLVPSPVAAAPPPNDAFAARRTIPSVPFQDQQSTVEATTEAGEPESPCGSIGKTVWYQYTPPSDVVLKADTRGSDYDTMLAVWTGPSPSALAHVGCSDDANELESRVLVLAEAGTTYLFQVGGFEADGGNLRFTLQPVDAGVISGTVRAQAGGPLEEICVEVLDADFFSITGDTTDAAGHYRVAVRSGRYLVQFSDWCDDTNEFQTEWYNDRPSYQTADEVEVVGTSQVGGIDADMAPGCPFFGDFKGPHYIGTPGPDTFKGGPEGEVFCGMEGADRLSGGGGRDHLTGWGGRDRLVGGEGNDSLSGSEGRDRLVGGEGKDFLDAGAKNDRLAGGADNDQLFGDQGRDLLSGGGGDDRLRGEKDADVLRGGSGDRDLCDGGKGLDRASAACERVQDVP
jgi:hypothetical protein